VLEIIVVCSWLETQFLLQCDSKSHDHVQAADLAEQILLSQFNIEAMSVFHVYPNQTRQYMRCEAKTSPKLSALEVSVHRGGTADAEC
jgi:hypothetical protein